MGCQLVEEVALIVSFQLALEVFVSLQLAVEVFVSLRLAVEVAFVYGTLQLAVVPILCWTLLTVPTPASVLLKEGELGLPRRVPVLALIEVPLLVQLGMTTAVMVSIVVRGGTVTREHQGGTSGRERGQSGRNCSNRYMYHCIRSRGSGVPRLLQRCSDSRTHSDSLSVRGVDMNRQCGWWRDMCHRITVGMVVKLVSAVVAVVPTIRLRCCQRVLHHGTAHEQLQLFHRWQDLICPAANVFVY